MKQTETTGIDFTRVNNDVNGNPRYVCHFLNLLNENDESQVRHDFAASLSLNPFKLTGFMYDLAVSKAKRIGGKRFHNKQYGGGIVFQSYSLPELERHINEVKNS